MRVAVVGTGYVGLVTAAGLASVGHDVTCIDNDLQRVEAANRGVPLFHEPGLGELLTAALRDGRFHATGDLPGAVSGADVTFIAVGTPSSKGDIDLTALSAATESLGRALAGRTEWHLVVVKSTVVPGTTDTLVRGLLEGCSGRRAGAFGLCMNPEFLREGTAVEDFLKPDRIVIGQWDDRSGAALAELYQAFDCPVVRTSLRNAELAKYASNALLATLISFSNEMAALCEATPDTDIEEVMDILHLDRRFSVFDQRRRQTAEIVSYLRAGCGFGGSCLPKDLLALRRYASRHGVATPMLDAVMAINDARPASIVDRLTRVVGKLEGAVVGVLGLTFKPGTDDLRDSPGLRIIELLLRNSAVVRAFDPQVRELSGYQGDVVRLCSTPEGLFTGADAAVLVTAWPEFRQLDWDALCGRMRRPVIVDGRNVLRGIALPQQAVYVGIGKPCSAEEAAARGQHV